MATSTFIHNILWIIIGLLCAYGLIIDQFQQTLIAQYIIRILYIIVAITGLIMVVHTVAFSPLIVWMQFALEIGTMIVFDFALTYKSNQKYVKERLSMISVFIYAGATLLGLIIQYLYG